MKVYLSPQDNHSDDNFLYTFTNEVITATFRGVTDTFDFTQMPLGALKDVKTTLEINPIVDAERTTDGLSVILLNFINRDSTKEELFPDWMEVQ